MSNTAASLEALEAKFAAEDAEDARQPDVPGAQRDLTTFDGFASGGATPREVDGTPYESLND